MPNLAGFLRDTTVGIVPSLALAALAGLVLALLVGLPLMRLSGLAAGIATFAVLGITYNVLCYCEKIGPGANASRSVPETTGIWQAAIGAAARDRARLRLPAQPLRADAARDARGPGRRVGGRDLRLPPAAARVRALRRARRASRAGSTSTCCRSTSTVYLDLTFVTLAMLVFGGSGSLLGRRPRRARGQRRSTRSSARRRTASTSSASHLNLPAGTRLSSIGAADGARPDPAARPGSPAAAS